MEIIVIEQLIETKEIADIKDIEAGKKHFLDRKAGFYILMRNGKKHTFYQDIPYESYPSEISNIKSKWKVLMDKVISEWEKDKVEIKIFNID